jgi:pimeloyl-ACP methyl ester carboxylesterase
MRIVFVHGACVRDGAWWWHPTGELLADAGVRSDAPALPSCGEGDGTPGHDGPGLAEDVAAVSALLRAGDEPTIVVAHSYGGVVTAQAAIGVPAVRHVVLVSSYLAEPGEALASFGGDDGPAPFLDVDLEAGTFGVRPELAVGTFLHDCLQHADEGVARLVRQSVQVTQQPVEAAVWGEVPTTYVVCTEDRGTPAERQRSYAQRADRVVEVDAGHHPMLSRPAALRDLLLGLELR